jgi:hypothetical protein
VDWREEGAVEGKEGIKMTEPGIFLVGGKSPNLEGQQRLGCLCGYFCVGQRAGSCDLKLCATHNYGANRCPENKGPLSPWTLPDSLRLGSLTFGVREAPESGGRCQL